MSMANVTGVGGGRSGEDVIVVCSKVALDRLSPEDAVPGELEGVPVRVLSMGEDEDDLPAEPQP